MTTSAERTFIIPVSNGIFAHREGIGAAIWVFLWLIDHTSREVPAANGKVDGLVYGGRPVLLGEISTELKMSPRAVRDHLFQLAEAGYIRKLDHGIGRANGYAVVNSQRARMQKKSDHIAETPAEKWQGPRQKSGRVTEETPAEKRRDPARKTSQPRQKSGNVIKETHHTYHTHQEEHATAPSETFALTTEQSKPENQKPEKQSDSRHGPVWRFIQDLYREKNRDSRGRPLDPPDIPKCNGVLRDFLHKCNWPAEDIFACVVNRFDSDKPPASESPHMWIPRLTTWRNSALNTFNTPKTEGGNNGKRNRGESILNDNCLALQNALAGPECDNDRARGVGDPPGRALGPTGCALATDGQRALRLVR
jgi:hypothetical protein